MFMMKNLFLRRALLVMSSFLFLYSCRMEDNSITSQEQTEFRVPIEMFVNFDEKIQSDAGFRKEHTEKEVRRGISPDNTPYISTVNIPISPVSYKVPFRETIKAFLANNAVFSQEFYSKFGHPFYAVSTYTYGNNSKAIAFPILKGDQVTAFIHGITTPNRDYVQFTIVQNNDPTTLLVLGRLQDAVDNLYDPGPVLARGFGTTEEHIRINEIEEITITMLNHMDQSGGFILHQPGKDWWKDASWEDSLYGPRGGSGQAMSGDGSKHKFPDYLDPKDDPCDKTKKMLESQKNKNITDDLKQHMANGAQAGEKGWRDNKTDAPTQTTQNTGHRVNFGDPSGMNGGYHNHTGTGVNIFSADDISTLIEIARYQNIGSTGNAYMGIMAPGGIHYVMYFNGTHHDMPAYGSYTEDQLKNWNDQQWSTYINTIANDNLSNNQKLEKVFSSTLRSMGLQNKVILHRIEGAKISIINQNLDGTTTVNPCNI